MRKLLEQTNTGQGGDRTQMPQKSVDFVFNNEHTEKEILKSRIHNSFKNKILEQI